MGGGSFSHSQGTNIASRSTLTWNGLAGAGLNFSASGMQGIAIGVNSSDLGLTWVLELIDGNGKTSTKAFSTTQVSPGSPEEVIQLFSSFTTDAGFDYTDIDSISFVANQTLVASLDTDVDYVRVVPEPATLALFVAQACSASAWRVAGRHEVRQRASPSACRQNDTASCDRRP